MSRTVPHLRDLGWDTIDCIINGGIVFSICNAKLRIRINGEDLTRKPVMIFDLWSNFTHR